MLSFAASASLLLSSAAALSTGSYALHESRASAPTGFVDSGPAPPSQQLNFLFGLVSSNVSGLEDLLYAMSTPSSATYGQHLSLEALNMYLAPSSEAVSAVNSWLSTNGLTSQPASPSGDWISLTLSVAEANKLLETQYNVYTHQATSQQLIRTLAYSLPSNLTDYIDAVHPTISFDLLLSPDPVFRPLASAPVASRATPSICNATVVTPDCVLALYAIPSAPATVKSNRIGVTAFSEEWANKADLSTFLAALRPNINPSTPFSVDSIDGGIDPQNRSEAGIEANLDTQYTVGIATEVPVVFLTVGNTVAIDDFIHSFVDVNSYLLKDINRPQVITTSYGWDESAVSPKLNGKICTGFLALGVLGTSVLFASGDGGVAGGHGEECTLFPPAWPSECPFVTAVGATAGFPETAASFSSGGFSNQFHQPLYQEQAVSSYLNFLGSTYAGLFNKSGRAYPDVSAIGVDVEIVWDDEFGTVDGTSCSSPIFASVIGLINDKLAAVGRPPLGFLNPFLYANPGAFNDITTGSNPGCNTTGFPATKGWDPVTGLGTPKFESLLSAAGL